MDSRSSWEDAQGSSEEFVDTNDDEVLNQSKSGPSDDDNDDKDSETAREAGRTLVRCSDTNDQYDSTPFSLLNVNLRLLRNISALSDAAQHRPKPHYSKESRETFDSWLERALVAISPDAGSIIFANQSSDKAVFLAKLKMEPIDQYTIKRLLIPLDYDEEITSLICLSIMSTQVTSLGAVDWNVVVIGLSSGYVKFYTEQSNCLLTLKFCDEPVVELKCQTRRFPTNARSQAHFASIVDELLVVYRSVAIVVDGIGLYENLRLAKTDIMNNSADYDPAYNLNNLPSILTCQKWPIETSRVITGDLLGIRCTTRFDTLRSSSIDNDHVPSKANARTLAIVGSDPFMSCYRESKEPQAHSYKEMITSLLPFWSKTQQTRLQMTDIEMSSGVSLFDKGRVATSFVPSPDKRLAIITDNFGRIQLVDVTNWLVIRIWKGYRSAECGWIEAKKNPENVDSSSAFFVVIYAPKRGLLEIWLAQRGPRVAAFNVGKGCRLLYCGHKLLNMRTDSVLRSSHNLNSSYCYLLNAKSETLFVVDVPYSYSLHKESDQKSRDLLLIEELISAVQNDLEVSSISETLHRVETADSLEIAINNLCTGLSPGKIVKILENLINKIMTSYNNHSGQGLSADDKSIVDLCKRIIRLCSLYEELSKSTPNELRLPDVNQRLIEQYEEHPDEIDDFSEKLGWSSSEVLRYLSLLSLERSFKPKQSKENPWPNLGEPLSWSEWISCFDLKRIVDKTGNEQDSAKLSIRLRSLDNDFLRQDQVLKTSIFLYNQLSESFFRSSSRESDGKFSTYNYIEPSSRLALLFQFWLSTSLCGHWKMWAFLQQQVGQISDELKVVVMTHDDDQLLVDTWEQIYQLILESDNHFAAIVATNVIKNDTLRSIEDRQKEEKLRKDSDADEDGSSSVRDKPLSSIDWECLCIDAERMSLLGQQLEDLFLLDLLLKYSPKEGRLVGNFQYKISRRTIASLLRAGPTIVSELIAQWAAQTGINLKIFTQPYGIQNDEEQDQIVVSGKQDRQSPTGKRRPLTFVGSSLMSSRMTGEEHSKELLHHIKTSFPCNLNPDVILLNCIWEFCHRWTSVPGATAKADLLHKCRIAIDLLSDTRLRHSVSSLAFKTFFQRTFERFVLLVETNATMLSSKSWRTRDNLTRKELNMSEDCLQDFVNFCCDLTELMMQTSAATGKTVADQSSNLLLLERQQPADKNQQLDIDSNELGLETLLEIDEWWSMPSCSSGGIATEQQVEFDDATGSGSVTIESLAGAEAVRLVDGAGNRQNLLAEIALAETSVNRFDVDTLIDLNRLANLMNLALRLNIVRPYPLTLIGEESRKQLKLDLQQSPKSGADIRLRMGSLEELRHKFARRCVLGIVANMTDESSCYSMEMGKSSLSLAKDIDINERDRQQGKQKQSITGITQSSSRRNQMDSQATKPLSSSPSMVTPKTMLSLDDDYDSTGLKLDQSSAISGNKSDGWSESISDVASDADDVDLELDDHKHNNELMLMFGKLLSLASEWQLNSDELNMELVFELYRCNYDKLASQISNRVRDTKTLAIGLLKISSQRILVLFGLSPSLSSEQSWKDRSDKWSLFSPNVSQWLRAIQQEEMRRELAALGFSESLKPTDRHSGGGGGGVSNKVAVGLPASEQLKSQPQHSLAAASTTSKQDNLSAEISLELLFGLQLFVLPALRHKTKLLLESATNHLDGQASRIAYDLLQLLESQVFDKFFGETLAQVSS